MGREGEGKEGREGREKEGKERGGRPNCLHF